MGYIRFAEKSTARYGVQVFTGHDRSGDRKDSGCSSLQRQIERVKSEKKEASDLQGKWVCRIEMYKSEPKRDHRSGSLFRIWHMHNTYKSLVSSFCISPAFDIVK